MNPPADGTNARERAEGRKTWQVRKMRLGEEGSDDLSATTSAAERLGMMWQLAKDAWALAGRPIPDYPREEMTIAKRRLHDPPADGTEP